MTLNNYVTVLCLYYTFNCFRVYSFYSYNKCLLQKSMLCYIGSSFIHLVFTESLNCNIFSGAWFNLLLLYQFNVYIKIFIQSTVVFSDILGLHIHVLLTHWLTQSNFSPASSILGKCTTQMCHFLSFILYFHCTFSICRYFYKKILTIML